MVVKIELELQWQVVLYLKVQLGLDSKALPGVVEMDSNLKSNSLSWRACLRKLGWSVV